MNIMDKLKSKNLKAVDLLLIIAIVFSAISVLYSIFTFGRANIHSDTAVLANYVKCVFRHKALYPKNWNYVNGELWGIDKLGMSFGQALFWFIKNSGIRRMCASAFQIIVGYGCLVIFSKKVLKDSSWLLAGPLCTLFLWGAADFVFYQGPYAGYLIWHPLLIAFAYLMYDYEKKKWSYRHIFLYAITILLMSIGGIRVYAEYVLPLLFATIVVCCIYAEGNTKERIILFFQRVIVVTVPAFMGSIIYKLLCKNHEVNNVNKVSMIIPDSLESVASGLLKVVKYHFECFGYDGGSQLMSIHGLRSLVSITLCIIICLIVPIFQAKRLNTERQAVVYFFYFVLIHNAIIFVFSALMDFTSYYHVLGNVMLFGILSARYIYAYWISNVDIRVGIFWGALFFVAVCISSLGLINNSSGWRETLEKREKISNELIARDLHKGYATFWTAYSNEIYSNAQIKYCGVKIAAERLQKYSWLVDSDRYFLDDEKTFVMLTKEEMEGINDRILYGYSVPVDEFVIEDVLFTSNEEEYNTDVYVFVYDHDYGINVVDYLDDDVLDAREMNFNHIGIRDNQIITMAVEGMVFGPYDAMEQGSYTVTIKGSNLNNCTFNIYSENTPNLVKYDLTSSDDYTYQFDMELKNRVDDIQFQIINSGLINSNNAEFLRIEIEKK